MKRSKFSEEQITYALRQHEASTPVDNVCREFGVSQASFYAWKKKYAQHGRLGAEGSAPAPRGERPDLSAGWRT